MSDAGRSGVIGLQPSLYCPRRASAFWHGTAANQTRWSLGFEAPRWSSGHSPMYFVGHGLVAGSAALRSLRFSEYLQGEDIELGYRGTLCGFTSELAAGADRAESASSVTEFMTQSHRWFVGELTALADVAANGGPKVIITLLPRMLGMAFWAAGPPIVLLALRDALSRHRSAAGLAIGYLVTVELAGALISSQATCPDCGWKRSPTSVPLFFLGFVVKPILGSLAASRALLEWAVSRRIPVTQKATHRSKQDEDPWPNPAI